jgi:putative inorganic carbon (HCO3(-)) transporter
LVFFLTEIYIFLSYVRLLEMYPEMADLRLMLWLALICLPLSFYFWNNTSRRTRPSVSSPQFKMTLLFFFLAVFSWLRVGWFIEAWGTVQQLQTILGAFVMVVLNLSSLPRFRKFVYVFIACGAIMSLQGIAGYHFNWNRELFVLDGYRGEPGSDPPPPTEDSGAASRMKNIGFLSDPNDLAQSLATALALLGIAWKKKGYFVNALVVIPTALLLLYAIFITHSRGGLVAVGVLAMLAFRERLGKVKAAILTGLLIAAALAVNVSGGRAMRDESSDARIEAWGSGMEMLRERPVFGVGFNAFIEYHRGLTAHNTYVLCFAEMGLVGYFVWMSLIVVSMIELTRIKSLPGEGPAFDEIRKYAGVLRLAFSTFLVAAFFLSRTYILTLYLLVAMSMALADIARRGNYGLQPLVTKYWCKQTAIWVAVSIGIVYIAIRVNHAT